jgi:hypothetical protein
MVENAQEIAEVAVRDGIRDDDVLDDGRFRHKGEHQRGLRSSGAPSEFPPATHNLGRCCRWCPSTNLARDGKERFPGLLIFGFHTGIIHIARRDVGQDDRLRAATSERNEFSMAARFRLVSDESVLT